MLSIVLWVFYLWRWPIYAPLFDYHVAAAGAWDLLDGTLYRAELRYPGRLPIDVFNYPPLLAAVAVPFAALPEFVGGTLFVLLNLTAMGAGTVFLARILGLPPGWAGIGFGVFTLHPWAVWTLMGNINPLMFGLSMAFIWLHLNRRQPLAGVALAIAIGLKLWPLALVPLLMRKRRWTTLAWAIGALVVQGVLTVLWLGVDVIGPMLAALTYRLPLQPDSFTLNPWPAWVGYVFAAVVLLIPATGRLGLGLAILAGMALVPNLWRHYLPTIVAGLLLARSALLSWRFPALSRSGLLRLRLVTVEPELSRHRSGGRVR